MDDYEEKLPQSDSDEGQAERQASSETIIDSSEITISGSNSVNNIFNASAQDFIDIYEYATKKVEKQLQGKSWVSDLEENLRNKKEQMEFEDEASIATSGAKPLETLDDIADWYENLPDEYTQSLVQTMAALYGAQALDIARLMKTFLPVSPSEQQVDVHQKMFGRSAGPGLAAGQGRHVLSDSELYRRAYIEKKRVHGKLHLFWQNLDNSGRFPLLVLRYLAEETIFSSGPDLVDILRNWAENEPRDCAWRAARALGVILFWRSSTQALSHLASQWANGTRMRDWRNAASLLVGAYSTELLDDEKKASDPKGSDVLRLLNRWVDQSQKSGGWRVGCASAETYDLLDKYKPDIALDGLEKLLRFPGSGVSNTWESIPTRLFTTCISNYVSIACSKHIRNALGRLAYFARMVVYQEQRPAQIDDEFRYQGQCEFHLEAVLTIFFLIATFSFVDGHTRTDYSLREPLPDQPKVSGNKGRDILLSGVLSSSEQPWRDAVMILLCAAFFAQKEEQALHVLRRWLETIEAISQTDQEQQLQLQETYHTFIINLHQMLRAWEIDPCRGGFGLVSASSTLRYYLRFWLESYDWNGTANSQFMRKFARKIVTQLGG